MLNRFTTMIDRLVVYPKQMEKNLQLTNGIFFSQAVMLRLAKKGLSREEAYRVVQKSALSAWDSGKNFKDSILKDATVKKYLTIKEIEGCCTLKHYLQHVDQIFTRVFAKKGSK
jgi:adenylosuccinate lyase